MRFAIAHVQHAAVVNQHTVRPRERAPEGIGFGAVTALTGAEHGPDDACRQIDLANHMTLCIGHVQRAARPCEAFRPGQLRRAGLAAVTRVPLLASASDMVT